MVGLTSDYLRGCNMNWRSGCASVALIFIAQGAQAQPVGYEEALRAARLNQPVLQARELEVEALRSTAEAADELPDPRSEEHTSELQSLMRSSYAVFCLKKQKKRAQERIGSKKE